MDSLEINKAFAALLVAGIAFLGSGLIADALVHPRKLDKPAIKIEGVRDAAGGAAAAPQPDPPVAALLASANPAKGEADTKRYCVSCHSFEKGGAAKVGPNLYGVVGDKHGHMAGFSYSSALTSKTGPWTFDALYEWLKSPRSYAPGTKMSFAGLEDPKQRADIIAYLNQNSDHPQPLPAAPAAAAAPVAAPAAKSTVGGPASNVAAPQPGRVSGAAGQQGARPGQAGVKSGQMSQPSANQNMPQAADSQGEQPPNARTVMEPAAKAPGQPQPSPAAKSP